MTTATNKQSVRRSTSPQHIYVVTSSQWVAGVVTWRADAAVPLGGDDEQLAALRVLRVGQPNRDERLL
jgi:hypothetical protein